MAKKAFKIFLISVLVFASGCVMKTKKPVVGTTPKTPILIKEMEIQKLDPVPVEQPSEVSQPPIPSAPQVVPISPQQNPQALVLPKFGFIFSGGGAKAWGHIGVLKELQKLKWPVHAVGGFEWGAVVAATYAQNLSANEVEWELSKLKEFEKWESFLKAAYAKKMTSDLKVPFVCPSLNIAKQNIYLLNRGQLDQLLRFCISSPGLVKPVGQSVAYMNDVPALAQHLRATGATKVILVNVMAQGTAQGNRRSFLKAWDESDNIIWAQAAAALVKKPQGVDELLEINLDDYGIKDLDKRRDIVAKASELSYNQLKKLADKFGL